MVFTHEERERRGPRPRACGETCTNCGLTPETHRHEMILKLKTHWFRGQIKKDKRPNVVYWEPFLGVFRVRCLPSPINIGCDTPHTQEKTKYFVPIPRPYFYLIPSRDQCEGEEGGMSGGVIVLQNKIYGPCVIMCDGGEIHD